MPRLNLNLNARDGYKLSALAERARLMPGTYARLLLVRIVDQEFDKLEAAGEVERFPQVDLFSQSKGGKRVNTSNRKKSSRRV